MDEPRIVNLPSGAKLSVGLADFTDAKNLLQAYLRATNQVEMEDGATLMTAFTASLASKEVDDCLWACFAQCLYDGLKITQETFSSKKARSDYMTVCLEVEAENLNPFVMSPASELSIPLPK